MPKLNPSISLPGERLAQGTGRKGAIGLIKGSKAIAQFTGLSQRDVLKLTHAGDFPAFIVGNKLVSDPAAIKKWLQAKTLLTLLRE